MKRNLQPLFKKFFHFKNSFHFIFLLAHSCHEGSLEQAMMDALINDRVDFVRLLLENGVSMRTFLTIPRLEELYNTRQGPTNTLRYLIRDVKKHVPSSYRYTLPDIGLVLQHLMGGGFVSSYLKKSFRQKYNALKKNALLACKLYKAMAHEADQDDLEVDISDELRKYAEEFQKLALELLEHCYKVDDDYTQQLLTYELRNFSDQTCLSLAVAANHREFVAHTCCQMLLNDMWMGGLRMRKNTALKISYMTFLACFTYVVLLKTLHIPRWQEYYVIAYIGTLALEKMRMVIAAEPAQLLMKLRVYMANIWNIWDTCAILFFFLGVGLRFNASTLQASRIIYIVDVVLCFGIVRQAIHFQHENPSWLIARNVVFYPYWMIYGELFAEEIDPCMNPNSECSYGAWVAPALMCIYLLIANILLVNLLIARFNATFIRNNANSREIWKFQRYQLIIVYELRPLLPPPLIILSHVFLTLKFIKRRCQGKRDYFDNGLKLFLSSEDTEKLHDFEEENVEDYFREKEQKFQSSTDERIRLICDRVENMTMRMDDMYVKENAIRISHQAIDFRLSKLEEVATQMGDSLSLIENVLANNPNAVFSDPEPPMDYTSEESLHHTDGSSQAKSATSSQHREHPLISQSSMSNPAKRSSVQDRMRRFTEYSRPSLSNRRSPSFGLKRSWSLRSRSPKFSCTSPLQLKRHSLFQFYEALQRSSPRPGTEPPTAASVAGEVEEEEMSKENRSVSGLRKLQQRRNGNSNLHVDITKPDDVQDVFNSAESSSDTSNSSTISSNRPPVKFSIEPLPEKGVYSTASIESDTRTATLVPGKTMTLDLLKPKDSQFSLVSEASTSGVVGHTPVSPLDTPNSPSHNLHFGSSLYVADKSHSGSPASQMASLFTSLNPEYTTITDEIDTSCLMESPSPSTAAIYFDPEEKYTLNSEEKALKQAEEIEHRRMERVIRNRLRQISLDDSDSISDIAKMVVSDMDVSQDKHAVVDTDDVDDDDIIVINRAGSTNQPSTSTDPSSSTERSMRNIEIKVIRASIDKGTSHESDPQC
ncbi:TRPM3 [Acanthosepion pharaonis]|uniref:TRPM3 n=1 Tax=Acanthosepion pharaonis TaxID=158019 RepID=A0A812BIM5_ACAPH|nr:TRPM3 [Sepia pharaonis]